MNPGAEGRRSRSIHRQTHKPTIDGRSTAEEETLKSPISKAVESYLKGGRLTQVRIRRLEGRVVQGFIKIESKGERHLLDFEAEVSRTGRLSSLAIGGRKICAGVKPEA